MQADELAVRRRGRRREPIAVWIGTGWPSHGVGLRNAAGAPVRIVTREGERPVGDVDRARAPEQVHAGASYLHQGQHWRVVELDLDVGVARVEPDDGATYTVPRRDTEVRLLDAERLVDGGQPPTCSLGTVEVHASVVGYQRKDTLTGAVIDSAPLDLPRSTLVTRAFWYVVDADTVERAGLDRAALPGALHAIEHAAIGMLPAVRHLRPVGRRRRVHRRATPTPGCPPSSSTTPCPAAPGSPSSATRPPIATWPPPARASRPARATTGARRASRARSAATATTTSTSAPPSHLLAAILGEAGDRALGAPTVTAAGRPLHPHRGRAADRVIAEEATDQGHVACPAR